MQGSACFKQSVTGYPSGEKVKTMLRERERERERDGKGGGGGGEGEREREID